VKESPSVTTSSPIPITQLYSRGLRYDAVKKTRVMCSSTATTITCAAQRWMLRMNCPVGTTKWMSLIEA
jgi:hypothetical protein